MYRKSAILAAMALAVFVTGTGGASAAASECKLSRIAALDMIREPNGQFAVVAGVNGTQHRFLIGIGSSISLIFRDFVDKAGIPQRNIAENAHYRTRGGEAQTYGTIGSLALGTGMGKGIRMIVARESYSTDPDVVGLLGTDVLGNFDVEFDFAAGRFNLYSSDHCAGMGAYWAAKYAALPIDLKQLGKAATQWDLDGQPVTVTFDTTAIASQMLRSVAKDKFGLDTDSPGVEPTGNDDGDGHPVYRYRFKSLTAEGIAVNNLLVGLYGLPTHERCDGKRRDAPMPILGVQGLFQTKTCYGNGDISLGLRELSKLHLYFAFKENQLYFTAAGDH